MSGTPANFLARSVKPRLDLFLGKPVNIANAKALAACTAERTHSLRVRVLGVGDGPGEGSDLAGCDQGPPLIPKAPGRSQQTARRKKELVMLLFPLQSVPYLYTPHAATDAARANLLPTALPIDPRQPVPKDCMTSIRSVARLDCRSRQALVRSYGSDPFPDLTTGAVTRRSTSAPSS